MVERVVPTRFGRSWPLMAESSSFSWMLGIDYEND